MVGGLPFVCVHLQQHAVSGNVTFIPGLVCVCRVTSVFFPSHILRLDLATSHPQRATRGESRPTVTNTWPCMTTLESQRSTGRDGGLALALFTLSATICQHGFIWVVFHDFFSFWLFSSSKYRKWKICLADSSLGNTLLFKKLGKEILAFRCHKGSRSVEKIYQFAMFFFFPVYMYYRYTPSQKVSVT